MSLNVFSSFFIPGALVFLSMALFIRSCRYKTYPRYPPGPKSLPIIGNLLDMPRTDLGRGFTELSRRYGDLVHLNVCGQHMLILGSYKAAEGILDKRSATTSDRPDSAMLRLCGLQWFFPFMPYGQAWRRRRRAFHQSFDAHVIANYHSIQVSHNHRLVHNLLVSPEKFGQHLQFSLAATALQIAYGIDLHDVHEEPYTVIERLVDILADVSIPGKYLVEVFPVLEYLPSWLPGANFKRLAAAAKCETESILTRLHTLSVSAVGKNSMSGMDTSIIRRILGDRDQEKPGENESGEREELCKSTAASAYLAGVETTNTVAQAFIILMALNPRVQQKAQQELDAVVGPNRLPNFDDIGSLPYLIALVKELFRWHSPAPLGVPHRTTSDEEYEGYFIPKGTVIFANIGLISRDPKEYPEPDTFIPERFLRGEGEGEGLAPMDPDRYVYGHGRRICPGRFFAYETIAMLCASVLHSFDINPPVDENGRPKKIGYKVNNDTSISHPVLYDFVITPRSTDAENLIRSMDVGSA